jgi:hypothetical protein
MKRYFRETKVKLPNGWYLACLGREDGSRWYVIQIHRELGHKIIHGYRNRCDALDDLVAFSDSKRD